jgi:hypothetical protein
MTIGVRRLFNQRWSVLWATTYTYGVTGFDEYFLGQLRRDGLNVTILADHGALADMWAALQETSGSPRLQRVNRDYLLRPVAWHGASFHPKTYLFGNEAGGRLLVGSGNADLSGLVAGYEVFASFSSEDSVGLASIARWRDWIESVISVLDDRLVAARWRDAKSRLPWLTVAEAVDASPLILNLDTPIADQFLQGVTPPIDELHVGAPFWDGRFAALTYLLDRAQPRRLHLYIGEGTRLDGAALVRLLERRDCDANLWTYSEPRFIHAKLVACVTGSDARVLSGSANISQVAMLMPAGDGGNVEAGVVAVGQAEPARMLFTPVGLELRALTLGELARFTPELRPDEIALPIKLLRAERLPDGHLSLAMTPVPPDGVTLASVGTDSTRVSLHIVRSEGTTLYPDLARGRTAEPWESTAPLVLLVDAEASPISNPIPIDDPEALEAALRTRGDEDRGALNDLEWQDLDTPVGRILEELQATCVFEPRRARAKRHVVIGEEKLAEGDTSFWQRIGELDVEAVDGRRRSRFGRGHLDGDPIFAQLRAMLIQAPYLPDLRPIRPIEPSDEEADDPDAVKRRWSIETRQRVRILNVLKRWCRAVRDPELMAIDPMLSTHDYVAFLQALAELWLGEVEGERNFNEDQLHQLLWILLESLVGKSGPNKGVFELADAKTRATMLGDLRAHGAPEWVAVLLFDVLRPERRERARLALTWQPLLVCALEEGVVSAGDGAVGDALRWAADYVDEEGWRARMLAQFGVLVRFSDEKLAPGYEYVLTLAAISDLLADVNPLRVLQAALAFRPASGVLVAVEGRPDRVSIRDGERAYARIGDQMYKSDRPVSLQEIARAPSDKGLAYLFEQPSSLVAG